MRTIYQKQIKKQTLKERNKASFLNDMAYGDFKDFARITVSYKVLYVKAFIISSNPRCDEYPSGFALIF